MWPGFWQGVQEAVPDLDIEQRSYHCESCDVWGKGPVCWMCGTDEQLVRAAHPFMPGGNHQCRWDTDRVYVAGGAVRIEDAPGP